MSTSGKIIINNQILTIRVGRQAIHRRGCHSVVHLMTGDLNALPFHHKHGYTIFGGLSDMPPGHTQYFMCKKLAAGQAAIT